MSKKTVGFLIVLISSALFLTGCQPGDKKRQQFNAPISVPQPAPLELTDLFEQELQKNPGKTQEFMQKVVDVAVKNHPGMAIQVENYASEEVKKEMQKQLAMSDVQSLLRLEAENKALKDQISALREKSDKFDSLQLQLYNALRRVESSNAEKEVFIEQISVLRKKADRCEQLERDISKAESEISKLSFSEKRLIELQKEYDDFKKEVGSMGTEGVTVVVWNKWSVATCFLEIVSSKTDKKYSFFLEAGYYKVINLQPGDYKVTYCVRTNKYIYKTENITVTPYVSIDFPENNKGEKEKIIKCHGLIVTPL